MADGVDANCSRCQPPKQAVDGVRVIADRPFASLRAAVGLECRDSRRPQPVDAATGQRAGLRDVGAGIDGEQLFSALVAWVEHGVEPEYLVAQVTPTRTRKICKYPDVQVWNRIGSIDDHNSFVCQVRKKDDKELIEQDKIDKAFETETKVGK